MSFLNEVPHILPLTLILGAGLGINLLVMFILWLIAEVKKDASIVDVYWGSSFVLLNLIYLFLGQRIVGFGNSGHLWVLLGMVGVWGLRLSLHIGARNLGRKEDARYTAMRKGRGKYFSLWSLVFIFHFQGVLSWLISWPLAFANYFAFLRQESDFGFIWSGLSVLGLVVWLVGFLFEAVGDYQLQVFKKDPGNRGRVMDTGLWRYTRHPNYFGDACVWWGLFLVAWGVTGFWWLVFSPVIMTIFLLSISGVSLLEKDIADRRPGYSDYKRRTSAFLPWFPKTSSIDVRPGAK